MNKLRLVAPTNVLDAASQWHRAHEQLKKLKNKGGSRSLKRTPPSIRRSLRTTRVPATQGLGGIRQFCANGVRGQCEDGRRSIRRGYGAELHRNLVRMRDNVSLSHGLVISSLCVVLCDVTRLFQSMLCGTTRSNPSQGRLTTQMNIVAVGLRSPSYSLQSFFFPSTSGFCICKQGVAGSIPATSTKNPVNR